MVFKPKDDCGHVTLLDSGHELAFGNIVNQELTLEQCFVERFREFRVVILPAICGCSSDPEFFAGELKHRGSFELFEECCSVLRDTRRNRSLSFFVTSLHGQFFGL